MISPEEYKKSLNELRKKNLAHQKIDNQLLIRYLKKEKARAELNKALQPILEKYMSENNISIIVDKKSIIVGKTEIDLTDKILKLLDTKLQSINLN